MDQRAPNLLDEALGLVDEEKTKPWPLSSRVVLVEDRVETSGAFVLHHLLKRALSPHSSNDVVVFLAFSQPFSHYDRVLRKLVHTLSLSLSLSQLSPFQIASLKFNYLTTILWFWWISWFICSFTFVGLEPFLELCDFVWEILFLLLFVTFSEKQCFVFVCVCVF